MQIELTDSQLEVVKFPYRPANTLKVIAGPGSGKTITLLQKVRHLVEVQQVRPDEILVLSLTNKAVDNIIDNLLEVFETSNSENRYTQEQLESIVNQIHVNTIHALANRTVAENEGLVSIIEENGWRGLVKLFSEDLGKGRPSRLMTTREFQRMLKEYKLGDGKKNEVMERLISIMHNCQVFTNEDVIIRASDYLKEPSEYALGQKPCFTFDLKSKIKVVLIDEFQDLFPSLLPLLKEVLIDKQVILFGDPNQSIYDFLGDNKKVINKLDDIHTGQNLMVKHLFDNFRCTPEIMSVAGKVMSHKVDYKELKNKKLVLKDFSGVYPVYNDIDDPVDNLEFLTDQLCELVCCGAKLSDIAILTKTNAHVQLIADHLRLYGIAFQKLTAQPDWMSDVRLQLLIDLLKAIVLVHREANANVNSLYSRKSDFSVLVTLGAIKGVGNQAIQSLYNVCNQKNISLWNYIDQTPKNQWPSSVTNRKKIENYSKVLLQLVEDDGFLSIEDPLRLLTKLSEIAWQLEFAPMILKGHREIYEFKSHFGDMLKVMKLCAQNKPNGVSLSDWFLDSYSEQGIILHHRDRAFESKELGAVNLSTIHSSKGLEFPIVFLMGGMSNMPMTRNLLYVGMTRARNLLFLNNVGNLKNYPELQTLDKPLRMNKHFWDYYNRDLRRRTLYCPSTSSQKYDLLQRKYGLNSSARRGITTWSLNNANRLSKLLRLPVF